MTVLPAAVLWDMDGTLVDSERYWMDAEISLVESFGGSWSHEDALAVVGAGLWHSARVLQSRGVELTEDEIIARLTDRVADQIAGVVPWRPGARALLSALRDQGIPTALVTMSMRRLAVQVVESIDFPAFDVIVAGDDVEHSKPHPAPYLQAAELLEVRASDCVAIEDSAPGVASAMASGAATIGVPLNVDLPEGGGYTVWPTLEGRTVADLGAVLEAGRSA